MRVIFDRSAFHGENFSALANSPLRMLLAAGSVSVFHTQVFLDETITAYGSSRATDDWKAHLAFAIDVCSGVFLDRDQILRNELVCGRGPEARHLLPGRPSKHYNSLPRLLETLRRVADSGDVRNEWLESAAEREEAHRKRNNQLGTARGIRSEVAEAIRSGRLKGKLTDYPFSQFRKTEFVRIGKLLMSIVDKRRTDMLACQWARCPARFPYYSAFIEGVSYALYYAAVEHNQPIDRNAQGDYEQLAYLTWADVVVSNDEAFFRSAFETLWKPRGKRLETAESFAALLRAIAPSGR
jgi:hypothetical protein